MTFDSTTAAEFPLNPGREYLATASGADFTIERKLEAGTWEAVPGSPLSDGEHKRLLTSSDGYKVRVTPSAAPSEFTLDQIQ